MEISLLDWNNIFLTVQGALAEVGLWGGDSVLEDEEKDFIKEKISEVSYCIRPDGWDEGFGIRSVVFKQNDGTVTFIWIHDKPDTIIDCTTETWEEVLCDVVREDYPSNQTDADRLWAFLRKYTGALKVTIWEHNKYEVNSPYIYENADSFRKCFIEGGQMQFNGFADREFYVTRDGADFTVQVESFEFADCDDKLFE